jgi:hypothetical protein
MKILTGWPAICKACGVKTKRTIKKKARKYAMPIVYLDGRPTITEQALRDWWNNLPRPETL